MEVNLLSIVILVGYIIGSIPFAVLVAKRYGVDIFKEGSGNAGATNVKRTVGKTAGNIVFALDALKGVVATGWALLLFAGHEHLVLFQIVGLCGAVLGHSFSVFIKFRGGKGVATTIGGLCVVLLVPVIVALLIWLLVFKLSRYVSLASIALGLSLPVSTYFLGSNDIKFIFTLIAAMFIVYKHRHNVGRLLNGTESRFEKE